MSVNFTRAAALAGGLLALLAGSAEAQGGQEGGSLAARVSAVPDGEVRMHFPSRPGLCGNADGERTMFGSTGDPGRTYMHMQDTSTAGPTRELE
jgi:hypothetical protein